MFAAVSRLGKEKWARKLKQWFKTEKENHLYGMVWGFTLVNSCFTLNDSLLMWFISSYFAVHFLSLSAFLIAPITFTWPWLPSCVFSPFAFPLLVVSSLAFSASVPFSPCSCSAFHVLSWPSGFILVVSLDHCCWDHFCFTWTYNHP